MEVRGSGFGFHADERGSGSPKLRTIAGALQIDLLDEVDVWKRDRLLPSALQGICSVHKIPVRSASISIYGEGLSIHLAARGDISPIVGARNPATDSRLQVKQLEIISAA